MKNNAIVDLHINSAECIAKATNILNTTITNVCTGDVIAVPNGTIDILVGGLAITVVVVAIAILIKTLISE